MQKKADFFNDTPDILWLLENRMNWEALWEWLGDEEREAVSAKSSDEYRRAWMDVLANLGELIGTEIAPNARAVDEEEVVLDSSGRVQFGPALRSNMEKLVAVGLPGFGGSVASGGLGAPFCLELVANEMLYRACPSTLLNCVWWSSVAHVIEAFSKPGEFAEVLAKLCSGEWSGNMALTEPDAGSDLSALRTWGEPQADGTWRLYGSKRFISNGNGEVSLVLAKNAKGAEGLKALNLFLCLRDVGGKTNIEVTKVEHKTGLKGSATCELKFDGAKARLLGSDGEGFKCMLKLMNAARIAVGLQAVGLMEAVFRMSWDYAHQRKSWGKPLAHHELIAEKLLDMEVETRAARSFCYQAAYHHSMFYAGEQYLARNPDLPEDKRNEVKAKVARHARKLRRWTPLIKYWVCERSVAHARQGVQILGGYGFTTEYRAEWWMRESLILTIYEGTSQIQAMMSTKDTLNDVIRKPRKFIEVALGIGMQAIAETDPMRRRLAKIRQLFNSAVIAVLFQLFKLNIKANMGDVKATEVVKLAKLLRSKKLLRFDSLGPALLHAERLTEMKSLVAICEILVKDAKVDPSRTWLAERMLSRATARIACLRSEMDIADPELLRRLSVDES